MWLKRTEQDWYFDYLTDEEEAEELDQLMYKAIDKVEELIDLLYKDDITKSVVETARASNFIKTKRKLTKWIDRYKQEIARILITYEQ